MAESIFVGDAEVDNNFLQEAPELELDHSPVYSREVLMVTDLSAVYSTIAYAKENLDLPSPHTAKRECTKAATIVSSAIDFQRFHNEAFDESPFVIPSVQQAAKAMQEVFGDSLEDMEQYDYHPIARFFNSLNGVKHLERPTISFDRVEPETFEAMERFMQRWQHEEEKRILATSCENQDNFPQS